MKALLPLLLLASAAHAAPRDDLRIISIDVEGGAATLIITPDNQSLLLDTGWPTGLGNPRPAAQEPPPPPTPSSAERIVAAAKAAGLTRLDHVLITHYHVDHVGGVFDLARLIPIGHYIDHGPNREAMRENPTPAQRATATATVYAQYEILAAGHRTIMQAGETLKLNRLTVTAITSDGTPIAKPFAKGPKADCTTLTTRDQIGGEENPRSLGVMLSWGKTRVLALADTTWNLENRIACPINLTGEVDLMLANNHGTELSNSPQLYAAANPRLVLVNNGPTKGGDGTVLTRIKALPRLQALWQLHSATRSPEADTTPAHIANIDRDTNHNLIITADQRGTLTVQNPRTTTTTRYQR